MDDRQERYIIPSPRKDSTTRKERIAHSLADSARTNRDPGTEEININTSPRSRMRRSRMNNDSSTDIGTKLKTSVKVEGTKVADTKVEETKVKAEIEPKTVTEVETRIENPSTETETSADSVPSIADAKADAKADTKADAKAEKRVKKEAFVTVQDIPPFKSKKESDRSEKKAKRKSKSSGEDSSEKVRVSRSSSRKSVQIKPVEEPMNVDAPKSTVASNDTSESNLLESVFESVTNTLAENVSIGDVASVVTELFEPKQVVTASEKTTSIHLDDTDVDYTVSSTSTTTTDDNGEETLEVSMSEQFTPSETTTDAKVKTETKTETEAVKVNEPVKVTVPSVKSRKKSKGSSKHIVDVGLRSKKLRIKIPNYDKWSSEEQLQQWTYFKLQLEALARKWPHGSIPTINDFESLRDAHIVISEYTLHIQSVNNANKMKIIYAITCYMVEIGALSAGMSFMKGFGDYDYKNTANDSMLIRWGEQMIGSSKESTFSPISKLAFSMGFNVLCVCLINVITKFSSKDVAVPLVTMLKETVTSLNMVGPDLRQQASGIGSELLSNNPIGTASKVGLEIVSGTVYRKFCADKSTVE